MKPSGLRSNFILLVRKRSKEGGDDDLIRRYFIVVLSAVQNSLVLIDGSFDGVGNVWLVCIVHLNCKFADCWWTLRHWRKTNEICCSYDYRQELEFFVVLCFNFFGFVSIFTTTFKHFQFWSQESLAVVKVIVPMRLKFKLYAVFIEWGSKISFLFVVGRETS